MGKLRSTKQLYVSSMLHISIEQKLYGNKEIGCSTRKNQKSQTAHGKKSNDMWQKKNGE